MLLKWATPARWKCVHLFDHHGKKMQKDRTVSKRGDAMHANFRVPNYCAKLNAGSRDRLIAEYDEPTQLVSDEASSLFPGSDLELSALATDANSADDCRDTGQESAWILLTW